MEAKALERVYDKVILLLYGSEEVLEKACSVAPRLFPKKKYLVVGIVPTIKSKVSYTSLYREVVDKWVRREKEIVLEKIKSIVDTEVELTTLHGRLNRILREVTRLHPCSILVLCSSIPANEKLFNPLYESLVRNDVVALVFTPKTIAGNIPPTKYLLILEKRFSEKIIDFIDTLSIGKDIELDVLWIRKPDIELLNNILESRKDRRRLHKLYINKVSIDELKKQISIGLEGYDLVVVSASVFYRRALFTHKLSELGKALILSSHRPLVILGE